MADVPHVLRTTCSLLLTMALAATAVNSTVVASHHAHSPKKPASTSRPSLRIRAPCDVQTVVTGDSCQSLASRCGISGSLFAEYNPKASLCSTLAPNQRVCCSSGSLPDITPKQNPDGSCAKYKVLRGDTCSTIAATYGLEATDLSKFNDARTWGWNGCDELTANLSICLSNGTIPMPSPQTRAVCGPTKPGTTAPRGPDEVELVLLNPCPLNACCDTWGQCGVTPEFCTSRPGPTKNPGTAPQGQTACVSNCGTELSPTADHPLLFPRRIGYYESWNGDRECLLMNAASLDAYNYTHVHWGFGLVTSDFDIQINDTWNQIPAFKNLTASKILSLGGWGFSTDKDTYAVLRDAMKPAANADRFADHILNFLEDNKFSGIDIDWEFPGAPDIPGIPPGQESDGPNYLAFLKTLHEKNIKRNTLLVGMPKYEVSIAAPASYWYLQHFPIAEMSQLVDYIVYMTYDLHGQWDYGNKYSQNGCEEGNCLRSHVNLTETQYALAMITKAGVERQKIVLGVPSYGRSFRISQADCTSPTCTYTGPVSAAEPGICTNVAGYMGNAEIYTIIGAGDSDTRTWYDATSGTDVLYYGGTQWVAYLSEASQAWRAAHFNALGFGGTADWAADLGDWLDIESLTDPKDEELAAVSGDTNPPACDTSYATMDELNAATDVPNACSAFYILSTLGNVLNSSIDSYNIIMNGGYDGKFQTYAKAVADAAGSSVRNFTNSNGNKYFSCIITEPSFCCDHCKDEDSPQACDYCLADGDCYENCGAFGCSRFRTRDAVEHPGSDKKPAYNHGLSRRDHGGSSGASGSSTQTLRVQYTNQSEPCPPDYSKRGYGPDFPYLQSIYWTLEKAYQFFADLYDSTAIPRDKIVFSNYNRGNTCPPSAGPNDECWSQGIDYAMPTPSGYGVDQIANPKDIVQKALGNSNDLLNQLQEAILEVGADGYAGDPIDLVDAVSLPVSMISQAVDSMNEVETVANEIDEAKKKAIILAFIGAILFFLPIAGQVLGSVAGLADVAAILSIVGAVGSAALDVYTVVDDPKNAPLAIFSLIMEPLGLAKLAGVSKAANIRRGLSEEQIGKLGPKVASFMGVIKKVKGAGVCRRGT